MANEQLRNMLNNLINEKSAEASLDFHNYLTEQVKEMIGLSEGAMKNKDLMDKEVKILSGQHKGKIGYVNKLIGADEAEVQLDDDGDEFYVTVKLSDIKKLNESGEELTEDNDLKQNIYHLSCSDEDIVDALGSVDGIEMHTNTSPAVVYVDASDKDANKIFSDLAKTRKTSINGVTIDLTKCGGSVKLKGQRTMDMTGKAMRRKL